MFKKRNVKVYLKNHVVVTGLCHRLISFLSLQADKLQKELNEVGVDPDEYLDMTEVEKKWVDAEMRKCTGDGDIVETPKARFLPSDLKTPESAGASLPTPFVDFMVKKRKIAKIRKRSVRLALDYLIPTNPQKIMTTPQTHCKHFIN